LGLPNQIIFKWLGAFLAKPICSNNQSLIGSIFRSSLLNILSVNQSHQNFIE